MNTNYNIEQIIKEAECNEIKHCFNQAIALYEKALAHNSTFFSAYYNLGALYEKIDNKPKAKDIYKMGINTARQHQNKTIESELSYSLLGLID